MAKTRKRATPYPVQVKRWLAEQQQPRVFSAKDVYLEIDHPEPHHRPSAIGKINQALARLWADEALVSFVSADGHVLREQAFIAPGSAAVSHPQLFGTPGSVSPNSGFSLIGYAEFTHLQQDAEVGEAVLLESLFEHELAESGDVDEAIESSLDLIDDVWDQIEGSSPPPWVTERLLARWISLPRTLAMLREGLDQAPPLERRQLVSAGLKRRGTPTGQTMQNLVVLCRSHRVWWERVARSAFLSYEWGSDGAASPHSRQEAVLLVAAIGGIASDEVELAALTLDEALPPLESEPVDDLELLREQLSSLVESEELAWSLAREGHRRARRVEAELAGERLAAIEQAARIETLQTQLAKSTITAEMGREAHQAAEDRLVALRQELDELRAKPALDDDPQTIAEALQQALPGALAAASARLATGEGGEGDEAFLRFAAEASSFVRALIPAQAP